MNKLKCINTVILNTGKHFFKKKMWLLPTAKKRKRKYMDFTL